jgi:glycosyltransferase involved in cell wall biosynthesis
MKISIITINYNNFEGLQLTLESVFNQKSDTCYELEYIVIDGGSTDGSVELLQECDSKLYFWISEQDKGVYHAMNKGIRKSSGEYLMFLNSGDYLINSLVLITCCNYIKKFKDADVYYGDTVINHPNNASQLYHKHPSELTLSFLQRDSINHQASLIKRALFSEFGFYPEYYKLASDYWLYLLAFIKRKKYVYINSALVFYDVSGISAVDGYDAYKTEKQIIWNNAFCDSNSIAMLLQEFDSLIKKKEILEKNNLRLAVQIANWVDTKGKKIKNILRSLTKNT